ncbi:hypothetical protein Q8A73_008274 [Channa argus]|nr:hypothetical protein Q8A73_008274 [Channa argus]
MDEPAAAGTFDKLLSAVTARTDPLLARCDRLAGGLLLSVSLTGRSGPTRRESGKPRLQVLKLLIAAEAACQHSELGLQITRLNHNKGDVPSSKMKGVKTAVLKYVIQSGLPAAKKKKVRDVGLETLGVVFVNSHSDERRESRLAHRGEPSYPLTPTALFVTRMPGREAGSRGAGTVHPSDWKRPPQRVCRDPQRRQRVQVFSAEPSNLRVKPLPVHLPVLDKQST